MSLTNTQDKEIKTKQSKLRQIAKVNKLTAKPGGYMYNNFFGGNRHGNFVGHPDSRDPLDTSSITNNNHNHVSITTITTTTTLAPSDTTITTENTNNKWVINLSSTPHQTTGNYTSQRPNLCCGTQVFPQGSLHHCYQEGMQ